MHSDLGPCCLHINLSLLMHNTDHGTVNRNLGQHVSSAQTDQHFHLLLIYNDKHAGIHGDAQFHFVHF